MIQKRYDEWIEVKKAMHRAGLLPMIREGEIYWCAFGENVGVEINGKGEMFSRPVLVFKKLSGLGFLGIPLSSQEHSGSWYVKFRFHNKTQVAVLAQPRVLSVSRLYGRMGELDEGDFAKVKRGFRRLYCE